MSSLKQTREQEKLKIKGSALTGRITHLYLRDRLDDISPLKIKTIFCLPQKQKLINLWSNSGLNIWRLWVELTVEITKLVIRATYSNLFPLMFELKSFNLSSQYPLLMIKPSLQHRYHVTRHTTRGFLVLSVDECSRLTFCLINSEWLQSFPLDSFPFPASVHDLMAHD